jgi:FkbM family methyltransferase
MKVWRPKLNIIELALLGVLVAFLSFWFGVYTADVRLGPATSSERSELEAFERRYGFSRHSEYGEEWFVRDFFNDYREGVFVDVGANHYARNSNTYYLETALQWSGLAIEPQAKFAGDYAAHRPRTRFIPLFVSDLSNRDAILYVPQDDLLASSTRTLAESKGGDVAAVHTNTTTLDDILDRAAIESFDFLSMDIELHEPQALNGLSIDRFRPRLVCIEAHAEVRQQIIDYFAVHRYVIVGKYLRADAQNLWFTPKDAPTQEERRTVS